MPFAATLCGQGDVLVLNTKSFAKTANGARHGAVWRFLQKGNSVRPRDLIAMRMGYRRSHTERRDFLLCGIEFSAEPCFYCGLPSTCQDHVPPLARVEVLLEAGAVSPAELITVPACEQCNRWLGSRPIHTPAKRRDFIKSRLRAKLIKYKRADWDDDELLEIGPNMTREIRVMMKAVVQLRERFAFITKLIF